MSGPIAFQGEPGAYSHQACAEARPGMEILPCTTFQEVVDAVKSGEAELGMLAVENSTYGRVADVHSLLPKSGLHIIDEAFVRVHVNLLGVKGARLEDVREAHGHVVILPQCAGFLKQHGIRGVVSSDNAKAAREAAEANNTARGALASELAAGIYGLEVLGRHIEDQGNNTTRFLVMSREPDHSRRSENMITSFTFQVRNIPAALYKALGGFATNGVNMTKLESYMVGGRFIATAFYAEVDGHPGDPALARALEELNFFTTELNILGVYPSARTRG
ncbi:prephenate dehydratase [Pseudogemmobacter faecipullorum]|uniref:prephenate dehydratase n=1 Tax=Pseudogemmobacter faecipullorum TaxID=2755041 RepID=A0ABS8CK48_9RHOB|nr:prephenate dehydratase [Pseudogemmobacter faecipullorum]MCB5409530.1 prephenate dehydratase [Pseudogemmobacter faecipullorum]